MVSRHAPRVPPCRETASQVQPWPRQPWLWYRTRASVGRTLFVLKTLHLRRFCPTLACTTPDAGFVCCSTTRHGHSIDARPARSHVTRTRGWVAVGLTGRRGGRSAEVRTGPRAPPGGGGTSTRQARSAGGELEGPGLLVDNKNTFYALLS